MAELAVKSELYRCRLCYCWFLPGSQFQYITSAFGRVTVSSNLPVQVESYMANKMLVLQIISVLFMAHIMVMAVPAKKSSSVHNKSPVHKREAIELLEQEEKPASLLFSAANLTRSHHYWTRKRGRDQFTQDPDYYYYQYGYRTTRRSFSLRSTPRPKRNTPNSLESEHSEVGSQLNEPTRSIQSSTRQQAGIEANLNDPNVVATDRTTEGPIYTGPKPHDRNKPRQSHKRFGSKL